MGRAKIANGSEVSSCLKEERGYLENESTVVRRCAERTVSLINKIPESMRRGCYLCILDARDDSICKEIVDLEEYAYRDAGLEPEGEEYFNNITRGLDVTEPVQHIGIRDRDGNLIGYFAVFRSVPGQFTSKESGKIARSAGLENLPKYTFTKLARSPDAKRVLAQTGLLRLSLGVFTLLSMLREKPDGFLMETHAMPGTRRMLTGDLFRKLFPMVEFLRNDPVIDSETGQQSPYTELLMHFPNISKTELLKMLRAFLRIPKRLD